MKTAARRSALMRLSFFGVGGLAAGAIMKRVRTLRFIALLIERR